MRSLLRSLPLAALVAAVACNDTAPDAADTTGTGEATPGGTLVIASPAEPDMLIPGLTQSIGGRMATDMMFDRLAEIGDGLNWIGDEGFTPRLARRWSWAPDSLSIAFELDPRARWHDGTPVRASDVKFTFALHKDPAVASPIAALIANIDSVSVRDSLTAVVWFAKRGPEQFYEAVYQAPIMPEHVYGKDRAGIRGSAVARNPVGSGRFRFVRWDAGTRVELVSDTANYRGRALLDRVVWTLTPDPTAALARLTAGEADFIENVPADQAERVDAMVTLRVFPYDNLQYSFMAMNLRARKGGAAPHPVFGDVRVRRAMSMAVDRNAMLGNVFGRYGRRSYGPFPRGLAVADTTLPLPAFDTTAAAALLDSAGWLRGPDGVRRKGGRPLAFSILVPQASKPRMTYAVLLQEQFKRMGANVELETADFPTFLAKMGGRDFDATLQAFSIDPSPSGARQQFGSEAAIVGGSNPFMYANPTFDAHLDSALSSYQPARAKAHMRNAYQQLIADAPAIWLYDVLALAGAHERIRMASMRADEYWAHIADWYIPEDERLPRDRVGPGTAAAR
ncbi:MAG TPA: ABC transporter substrate-binding protein [Gemmatimonadaceae bacterium]|nr:ABC transporter substrate-binding protein [Gemmatimonadaceae bacterium]